MPSRQGRGYATEALAALLGLAWREPGRGTPLPMRSACARLSVDVVSSSVRRGCAQPFLMTSSNVRGTRP
ncbi:MAG: hypothetical protein ABSD78_01030 [Acidimicrobiales bacterium]